MDNFDEARRKKFSSSIEVFEYLKKQDDAFISSSAIDNIDFLKVKDLKIEKGYSSKEAKKIVRFIIEDLLINFKIAKTPSYIDIDYEDIEDSQIIASAKATNAKVITRDKGMLEKYLDITISPSSFLKTKNQKEGESHSKRDYPGVPKTKIDFANLKKQYFMYQPELEEAMDQVLNSTSYIMGDAVTELENSLQEFTGAKHAITCGSGTDALLLAMMALDIGPGDEVITTPFTFIATAETIAFLGAKPVFVDIDEKTYNIDPSKIEAAMTEKTKAIMPVSLYGQPADMDAIQAVLDKVEGRRQKAEEKKKQSPSTFNLAPSGNALGVQPSSSKIHIIIDGAQSFGSTYKGKIDSNLGDISTTSFFPAKPLGCFGDGGAVFTNNDALAEKLKSLRVHGQTKRYHHKYIGMGGRMDTIQAAVLNVKLKYYPEDLKRRQEVAEKYSKVLRQKAEGRRTKGSDFEIILPFSDSKCTSAYAQYSIRIKPSPLPCQEMPLGCSLLPSSSPRNEVQAKLKEAGIPTAVHYPMPLHLQECFAYLDYKRGDFPVSEAISTEIMSLPMNPYLSDEDIEYICSQISRFAE